MDVNFRSYFGKIFNNISEFFLQFMFFRIVGGIFEFFLILRLLSDNLIGRLIWAILFVIGNFRKFEI